MGFCGGRWGVAALLLLACLAQAADHKYEKGDSIMLYANKVGKRQGMPNGGPPARPHHRPPHLHLPLVLTTPDRPTCPPPTLH